MRASLRQVLNQKRLGIPVAEKMAAADAVATRILAHLPADGGYIAGYWAVAGELPLHILQMQLPPDWIWCLPVVQPNRQLRFAPWRNGDALGNNRFGIPEPMLAPESCLAPEAMHAVVVPLLGFTRHGQRLGMGGGYYDASFAFRKSQTAPPLLIGAAFACQEIDAFEPADWDVALDAVATDGDWFDCSNKEMR
jgi:5-formyltetrahydrofolate cyclo-ligase